MFYLDCNCNRIGSFSKNCNEKGKCKCKTGFIGDKCDLCVNGYYSDYTKSCKGKHYLQCQH